MERNGEVVAEYSICFSESFRLDRNTFNTESSKMCKDDNSPSLFCNVPSCRKNDISMESEFKAKKSEIVSQLKNQCIEKLNRAETDYINSDEHMLSIIQKQSDHAMNNCYLPAWENSEIRVFPANQETVNKLINSNEVFNNNFNNASCTTPNTVNISDSSLDTTSDSFLQNYEDDTSSSVEEIFCPASHDLNEIKNNYLERHVSKGSPEDPLPRASEQRFDSASSCDLPKLEFKEDIPKLKELSPNKDRMMPQLIPLIYVEDDDPVKRHEEKRMEESKLSNSPEMPKLIAFSSETEDMFHSKKENDRLRHCSVQLFSSVEETDPSESMEVDNEIGSPKKQFSNSIRKNCTLPIDVLNLKTYCKKVGGDESSESEKFVGKVFQPVEDMLKRERLMSKVKRECESRVSDCKTFETKREKIVSDDDDDMESQDSVNEIRQPQVILRRISLDQCGSLPESEKNASHEGSSTEELENEDKLSFMSTLPSNDSDDNDSLTDPFKCVESKNSSNETTEIEEIEGVRFFQFRSKSDMEEFHVQIQTTEDDEEMIVPTKTNDITQIKGWRNKFFAPEADFQYPISLENVGIVNANLNATNSVPQSSVLSEDEKCFKLHFGTNEGTETTLQGENSNETKCSKDTKPSTQSLNFGTTECDSEKKPSISPDNGSETFNSVKPPDEKNPMSAFVSKELDDFLRTSATLNVRCLQKINPNIAPISPSATILKLGKLRKPDHQVTTLAALKIRNGISLGTNNVVIKVRKEEMDESDFMLADPSVPSIITLMSSSSSSDSSSDDDIPVARLQDNRKRLRSRINRPMPSKRVKRIKSDVSSDQSAQRLVIRLTKESLGSSEGYKVSDISCEKQETESPSSSSSSSSSSEGEELPEHFKTPDDSKLGVIKEAIFLKEKEPNLLKEFLINLNTLGTSKDVAMLVQSNQSYFDKGPVLTNSICSKATDALTSNKELSELKNKPSPKKKLKAWQKYLPKKLSTTQQQKFSKITRAPKSDPEITEKISNSKDTIKPKLSIPEKSSKIEVKNVSKTESSDKKTLNSNRTGAKTSTKQQHLKTTAKLQSPKLASEKISKMKKKTKCTEASDKLSFVERGKRSIRLPARYLDSAVLAAGTEWVSPIFVEDEKKNRKQLLEVLDKMTSHKVESNSAAQSENPKNNPEPLNKSNEVFVPKFAEKSSSAITRKTLKQPTKETTLLKKMKTNSGEGSSKTLKVPPSKKQRTLIREIDSLEEEPEFIKDLYPLPVCPCSPCSRTIVFDRLLKEFTSFCGHNVIEKNTETNKNSPNMSLICNETLCSDWDINSSEKTQNTDINKSPQNLNSNALSSNSKQNSSTSTAIESSTPINHANEFSVQSTTVSTPLLHTSNVLHENTQTIFKAPVMCNNSNFVLPSQVVSSASNINSLQRSGIYDNGAVVSNDHVNSGTVLNVPGASISNQLIFFLPVSATGPVTNTVQSINTGLMSNSLSPQTVQNFTSTDRINKPILVQKVLTDNPTLKTHLDASKSTPEYKLCPKNAIMTPILPKPAKATPLRMKLSNTTQNADKNTPVLYSSQTSNPSQECLISKSINIVTAQNNVLSTTNPSIPLPDGNILTSSPNMHMKAIKVGDQVYLYSAPIQDGEQVSSPLNSNMIQISNVSCQNQGNPKIQSNAEPSTEKMPTQYQHVAIESGVLKVSSPNPPEGTLGDPSDQKNDVKSNRPPKPSERRRKSPLCKRKCKDESDSDVDVLSVDRTFDAKSALKKSIHLSDTDLSDGECDSKSECLRSVNQKNRRFLIKKMFEKLRTTSSEFKKAKNCGEILDMTRCMVHDYGKQERSYKCIKRILRLRNAMLLKNLTSILQSCNDTNIRKKAKYQVIKTLAVDWENRRQERSRVLSRLRSKPTTPKCNTNMKKKTIKQKTASGKVEKEIEILKPEQSVPVEVPKLNAVSDVLQLNLKKLFEPVIVTDITEEPHVQLRILEAPEVPSEIQIDSQFQALDEKVEIAPQINPEEKTSDSSKKTSDNTKKTSHSAKKTSQVPAATPDGNTSDDDLLIIDLSDDHSICTKENSSPLKSSEAIVHKGSVENSPTTLKAPEASPARKFPGLIPLFAPNLYDDERVLGAKLRYPQALSEKYLNADSMKPDKTKCTGPQGLACNNNDRVRFRRTTITGLNLKPDGAEESVPPQRRSSENSNGDTFVNQAAATNRLGTEDVQKTVSKNDQTVLPCKVKSKTPSNTNSNISQKNALLHSGSANVLYKLGKQDTNKVTPSVPEEITIDDSDDEVVEVKDKFPRRTSSDSSQLRMPPSSTVHTSCVTKDPQTHSPHL